MVAAGAVVAPGSTVPKGEVTPPPPHPHRETGLHSNDHRWAIGLWQNMCMTLVVQSLLRTRLSRTVGRLSWAVVMLTGMGRPDGGSGKPFVRLNSWNTLQVWGGNPAKFLRSIKPEESSFIVPSAAKYVDLAEQHKVAA